MDKLGVFHANQTSMCLDPHLKIGAVKPVQALQLNIFADRSKVVLPLCYFCLVSPLFIAALWSPVGKS